MSVSGFEKYGIKPLKDPENEGKQVFEVKLNHEIMNSLLQHHHQLSVRITDQNTLEFIGPNFTQSIPLKPKNKKKTESFECLLKKDNDFIEVGNITKKGEAPPEKNSIKSRAEDTMAQEREIKERKKLVVTQQEAKYERSRGTKHGLVRKQLEGRNQPAPKRSRNLEPSEEERVPVRVVPQVPFDTVRLNLIETLLAQPTIKLQEIFGRYPEYSSADVHSVLRSIGKNVNGDEWAVVTNKIGENDLLLLSADSIKNLDIRATEEENQSKLEQEAKNRLPVKPDSPPKKSEVRRDKSKAVSQKTRVPTSKASQDIPPKKASVSPQKEPAPKAPKRTRNPEKARKTSNDEAPPKPKPRKPRKSASSPATAVEPLHSPSEPPKRRTATTSSTNGHKESPRTIQSRLKADIRRYEEKKQQFTEGYNKYETYMRYLAQNESHIKELEKKWRNAQSPAEKEDYANRIRKIHSDKKEEVHNTGKKCGSLVGTLNSLRDELQKLSDSIKTNYSTAVFQNT